MRFSHLPKPSLARKQCCLQMSCNTDSVFVDIKSEQWNLRFSLVGGRPNGRVGGELNEWARRKKWARKKKKYAATEPYTDNTY